MKCRILPLSVLLLISAMSCAGWLSVQSDLPRLWVEVSARPQSSCYQGPPRREVLNLQLGRSGPGVKILQERQISWTALPLPVGK